MFVPFTYLLWLMLCIFLLLFALGVWQRRVWRQWRALGLILAGALVVQRPVGLHPRLVIENAGWRHDP